MWYFLLYAILAVYVLVDAGKRHNSRTGWPVATLLLGPVVLPVYFAKRHLKKGEVREGGTGWNVLKNFALMWTLTMAVAGVAGMVGASDVVEQAGSDTEQAGAAIGVALGLGVIGFLWFVFVAAALVIGLFLKKSSVVEKGPTGPLATPTTGSVRRAPEDG